MDENSNIDTSRYGDYFEYYSKDTEAEKSTSPNKNRNNNNRIRNNKNRNTRNGRHRKGLKWTLIRLINKKYTKIVLPIIAVLIITMIIVSAVVSSGTTEPSVTEPETTAPTKTYQISGVPVIVQDEYKACCETYACTMLLQYLNFDIDVSEFITNYLIIKPVTYGADGNLYGPDMNSAFAGDIYTGYGINAPGMAKCMNNFLKSKKSKLTAYPILNGSIDNFCKEYILKDIPVMVWATTNMEEPYIKANWVIDYADEDSVNKIGDTVNWKMHEHCMVLIGFDKNNYYLCDSVAGQISKYDKETFNDRYTQIGKQAIVVK